MADKLDLPQGVRLVALDSVDSTNEEARRQAEAGAPHLTLVWARRQTSGRGRRGRGWVSEPGNLYASLLLRPDCPPAQAAEASFVACLSIADALAALGPPGTLVGCKWPNDVLIEGRKAAGILLESSAVGGSGAIDWLVIGFGVNVAHAPEGTEFPATSLAAEGYRGVSVERLLGSVCHRLLDWLVTWRKLGFAPLRMAWMRRAHGLGGPVVVRLADETLEGRFADLDERGALVLDGAAGRRHITAGDVFFRREAR